MSGRPPCKDYIVNVLRGRDRNSDGAGVLADEILASLDRAGFVVAHPDDVPTAASVEAWDYAVPDFVDGWNECRRHVFGGAGERHLIGGTA